ncbi:carotenoid biosynthesis protein [Micromonospora narathiwatensis]|uniref:Putative membrane protein n=1 Tax=Micromonospora narathiwatensis TaxID=299146 RepID=A0A1A8ZW45_9ACTN|nr:carotenoid biosynthesis protein [Micromonospora narathiwatensis]SBT48344.1 putative membrane protein [Micromonospora narathiwatensis]
MSRGRLPWALLAVLVLAQICYPLTSGATRAGLTVATVVLGYLLSVGHALLSRGTRTAVALVAVATGGGFAVEALGVATGFPFGGYDYSGELGPKLAGVPLIIPLAWTWMAWPAWLTAVRITAPSTAGTRPGPATAPGRGAAPDAPSWSRRSRAGRIALAAVGLAAWDLFLDPQMVAEGYWVWRDATPALPGLPGVPASNYLGWLLFAVLLAAALRPLAGPAVDRADRRDAPMFALYLWTYAASVLAHAVFLRLPASAVWGGIGMAVAAAPLAVTLLRARRRVPDRPAADPAPRVDAPA